MSSDAEEDNWLVRFDEPGTTRALYVEDDGATVYAYLHEEKIVADVWLANVGPTPETVDWSDRDAMPFQNPARYCTTDGATEFDREKLRCEWIDGEANLYVAQILWAKLRSGEKPGRSRLATHSGPLAQPLT